MKAGPFSRHNAGSFHHIPPKRCAVDSRILVHVFYLQAAAKALLTQANCLWNLLRCQAQCDSSYLCSNRKTVNKNHYLSCSVASIPSDLTVTEYKRSLLSMEQPFCTFPQTPRSISDSILVQ